MRRPTAVPVALLLLLLAGCGGTPPDEPSSRPTTAPTSGTGESDAPSPTDPPTDPATPDRFSDWDVGADVLPLRPDGFGVMRATPAELRERRLPTVDVLPPPAGDRYASSVGPITPAVRRRTGSAWQPGCPVPLADLRYLTVVFRGFDGDAHTGELVVAAAEADDVVSVFRELFEADFPIEEMRLVTGRDLDAPPTGDGNTTSAFACRAVTGGGEYSQHAYGLAIDVNPFQNPYLAGAPPDEVAADPDDLDRVVVPELASSYLDRAWQRPGMVQPDSVVVRAFARIGWSWGGAWNSLKDYQHFSATGR